MAYEKQTWVTGEVITEEKLNHMEDGIANSGGGDYDFWMIETRSSDCEGRQDIKCYGKPFDELLSMAENGEFIKYKTIDIRPNDCGEEPFDGITYSYPTSYTVQKDYSSENHGKELLLSTYDTSVQITSSMILGQYPYTYNPTTKEYEFEY